MGLKLKTNGYIETVVESALEKFKGNENIANFLGLVLVVYNKIHAARPVNALDIESLPEVFPLSFPSHSLPSLPYLHDH